MKICLVTSQHPASGDDYVDRLARGLAENDRVTIVAATAGMPWAPERRMTSDGVTLLRSAPLTVGRAVAAQQPDIVHLHRVDEITLGAIFMRVGGRLPIAMTLHDYALLCTRATLRHGDGRACKPNFACRQMAAVNQRLTASIGLVIGPSHYALDQHHRRGLFRGALEEVLPVGLEPPSPVLTPTKATYDVVWIGRMEPSSGVNILIRAFKKLTDRSLRLHLVPMEPAIIDSAAEAVSDERIRLYGSGSAIRQALLEAADCIVAPALWPDSFPVGIQMAFRCGVPVIASRIGGIPEVIRAGVNGLLVEPGDEGALAATIDEVRRAPELAAGLRAAAVETARLYDMRFHVGRLVEAYQRLLTSNRLRPFDRRAA